MWLAQVFETLVRGRRFILLNVFLVTTVAIVISLVLPKHFRASSAILPPDNDRALGGLMGLSLGHIAEAVSSFSLPIMATPSDLYAAILKSDTILASVVDQLNLQAIYDSETRWEAVKELRENFTVKVEPEGIIRLAVDAKTADLAAGIANAMVNRLDVFNREVQQTKGRAYSDFLDRRLVETDSSLKVAAESLKVFQTQYRAVSLDVQAEELIKTLAEQKGRLTSSEIELQIMKRTLNPDHPAVISKEREIFETRRRLLEIEGGAASQSDSVISALDIPLTLIPDLSLRYAVLVRDVKIQEVTYEMLSQQFEMYRLQAQRDTPTISVLDRAHPPGEPYKPRKRLIVITVFMLSTLAACGYVIVRASPPSVVGYDDATWALVRQAWHELWRKPLG